MTFRFRLMGLNGMASLTARRVGHCVNTSSRTERKRITLSREYIDCMATTGTVDYCCLFVNDTAASCKGTTNTAKHCRSYETHYPTLITRKFLASPGWRGVVGLLSPAHTVTAHELDEFSRSVTRLLPLFCRQISDITITTGTRSSSITVIPSDDCSCRSQHAAIIHVGRAC